MTPNLIPTERCGRQLTLDDETRHSVTARRNVLLALWAAGAMGFDPRLRQAYAWSIHFAAPRLTDEALVERLICDARRKGARMRKREVRRQLQEMELRAYLQLAGERAMAAMAMRRSGSRRHPGAKILAFRRRAAGAERAGVG